jgi:dihydrofolate synthase/folylpolyglutamate synthase
MLALLAKLGDPQRRYPAIHVVGTNGKSTTTRMTETLLADAGLTVGAYLSPHIRGWSERIRIGNGEADFEQAIERVRPHAADATQFEILTAAALLAFAEAEVDVAVVQPATTVVLGDPEWEQLARENGAERIVVAGASNLALATAAAESFLGRDVDPHAAQDVSLPGRLERRGDEPLEIWDGAHNLAGVGYLLPRLPDREYVLCCSILGDKRPELMLEALSVLGSTIVATESPNERSLQAGDLAARAEPYFSHVESIADPHAARSRALALAGPSGAVVVTGSLYLLSELSGSSTHP